MIPDIGMANGIMSVILNFAKAMPETIQFDIVYFFEKEPTRQTDIEALGGRVYKIDKPPKTDALKALLTAHKGEWQALHIHAPHFAGFIVPAARKAGIPKICVHCHSTEYSLKGNGKRNQLLSQYAKNFVKDKFACSQKAGNFWYGNKPFRVINNAIDCADYSFNSDMRERVRQQMALQDKPVIGHIGRTDIPQKNHLFLLSVFAEIVKKRTHAELLLMGAEPTEELTAFCEKNGIADNVRFLGLRKDIKELLQACDVFLFPSTREGLPVSVIEAQAAGLPVLMSDTVTDECIVTDLVHTKSLNDSPSDWAEVCLQLTEEPRRDTLKELQSAGWDLSAVRDELVKYYSD